MAKEFLIELGTEELPPTQLRTLAEAFAANFEAELKGAELAHEGVKWFAAPRRLALKVAGLAEGQADKTLKIIGPAYKIAFGGDDGLTPTKAGEGWANKNGVSLSEAKIQGEVQQNGKDTRKIYIEKEVKGSLTKDLIVDLAAKALANLPIAKPMRWGNKTTQFIRPVKTLTMLMGSDLIEGEILGVASDRTIRGHRFMGEQEFTIDSAEQYPAILEERGKVMADYEARKAIILADAQKAAVAVGGIADLEDDLVEEVTSLVEWYQWY